ncbi:hypothetical protein T310_9940 [Rasamsonia emersonii CBS 393.64]|uniref:Uncharacterized protein n=1 Tax=Rasamsonia emersonii (strain ATCC 16479 / CBS 393.64 / IMI 116815) TaxID=1408163 RepID=A0A0F4YE49_RASE3|nr:hypothetical protein T310_9940 [Rasamsonia emersonii CBS 393.64]KKA16464.1 hypothetical protein T310_9940 [Rasamsonia emersonii CBS 393.64]
MDIRLAKRLKPVLFEHGSGTQPCKKINHAKGHEFSWDPEDDNSNMHCLSLFRDDSCASQAGKTSTPTATATSQPQSSSIAGLSGGAIAGIVIGSVVGFFLIAGLLWFLYRRTSVPPGEVAPTPAPAPAPDGGYPPSFCSFSAGHSNTIREASR